METKMKPQLGKMPKGKMPFPPAKAPAKKGKKGC